MGAGCNEQKPALILAQSCGFHLCTIARETPIDVIDPTANTVVQVIHGIELPHGITFSPMERGLRKQRIRGLLDVVDRRAVDSAKVL